MHSILYVLQFCYTWLFLTVLLCRPELCITSSTQTGLIMEHLRIQNISLVWLYVCTIRMCMHTLMNWFVKTLQHTCSCQCSALAITSSSMHYPLLNWSDPFSVSYNISNSKQSINNKSAIPWHKLVTYVPSKWDLTNMYIFHWCICMFAHTCCVHKVHLVWMCELNYN